MRPNKLIMSAFGPYSGKVEVELDKLGQSGLYLITGDTGAGKTTIFDAITYALFGEASGQTRETSMFRSKYAERETPTEVELYFTCKNKDYYIKRNPEYERPKSRGEGFTSEKANAELHLPDGTVITKLKEVNSVVVEILGVDKNQFTQIAMIAQGDFLKLLLASTDDRKKIFQKLFKTQNYYILQENLKNESRKLSQEYDAIKSSIRQYINGIVCDVDDVLSIQVKKAKDNELSMSDIVELLEELIKKDSCAEEKYGNEISELDKSLEEITKRLTNAQTFNKAKESLEKSEAEFERALSLKDELEEKLRAEECHKDEISEITKKMAKIDAEIPDYDELDAKKQDLAGLILTIKNDEKTLETKKREQESTGIKISEFEKEIKTLENVSADKAKTEAEIKELSGKKSAIDNLATEIKEFSKLEKNLKTAQEEYKIKSEDATHKKSLYDSLNRAYLDAQAGILAGSLTDGQPCPVCGSTSHPHLAEKSMEAPTKQELEKAKNDAEDAQKEENEASRNAGRLKGVADEKKTAIDKLSDEILGGLDLEEKNAEISSKLSVLEETLSKIDQDEKRKKELELLLPDEREKLEAIKKDFTALSERISKNKAITETLEKRISDLTKKLMFESKAQAEEEKTSLESRKTELEEAFEKVKKAVELNENNIAAIKSRIGENKKLLLGSKSVDVAAEEEKQLELKEQKEELLNIQKEVHSRKTINLSSLDNIRQKTDEIKSVEERWMWVEALSNTANGKLPGKEKIMLETYIQMTYFDRIIERANTRLLVMSGGQYELKRRKEAENNQRQGGLELDVIDHYNGTERSVKTLSGGESFKASLSLALGLSDEIQSSAGGIRLDTMFVDEGFGSLDDESLAQAIKALSSLAEGNRLVGIISHVNELKHKIDKQIVVKKEPTGGSNVAIVV